MSKPLAPIGEPYPKDISDILNNYPKVEGELLELFRTFANSKRFLLKGVPNLLDKDSPLPLRIRELVIMRITANLGCEYEWGVHVAIFSQSIGLSQQQISDICAASFTPEFWSTEESCLLGVIDQLCVTGTIDDNSLADFDNYWTVEQRLEIFALCGTYHTVSYVANVAKLKPERFSAQFPQIS